MVANVVHGSESDLENSIGTTNREAIGKIFFENLSSIMKTFNFILQDTWLERTTIQFEDRKLE